MIRVNLLRSAGMTVSPVAAGIGGGTVASGTSVIAMDQQKAGGLKLAVILVFPLLFYAYEYSNISSLKSDLDSVNAELAKANAKKASYGDIGPRVDRYTKQKAKIDEQMNVIRQLTKNRLREVKALDSLQEITPPQVWFENLSINDGIVKAVGYSLNDEGWSTLSSKLMNSAIFSHFEPKSQTYENGPGGAKVLKFTIEFHVGRGDQE